jgi:hypothetical protein
MNGMESVQGMLTSNSTKADDSDSKLFGLFRCNTHCKAKKSKCFVVEKGKSLLYIYSERKGKLCTCGNPHLEFCSERRQMVFRSGKANCRAWLKQCRKCERPMNARSCCAICPESVQCQLRVAIQVGEYSIAFQASRLEEGSSYDRGIEIARRKM